MQDKRSRVVERKVAPGVVERHARECGRAGGRRCTCRPSFRARLTVAGRPVSETFQTLDEAIVWRTSTRGAMRAGGAPATRAPSPRLDEAVGDFLARARAGEVLARSGRPYASTTLDGYAGALFRHVRDLVDPPTPADHPASPGAGARRLPHGAALLAVLKDGYDRGTRDEPPGCGWPTCR